MTPQTIHLTDRQVDALEEHISEYRDENGYGPSSGEMIDLLWDRIRESQDVEPELADDFRVIIRWIRQESTKQTDPCPEWCDIAIPHHHAT